MASKDAFSALSSKFAVTQKVVRAQQDYIKDLERKYALLKATAEGPRSPGSSAGAGATKQPLTPSASQVAQLQRGVQYFRELAEKNEAEATALRQELGVLREAGDGDTTGGGGSHSGGGGGDSRTASAKHSLQLRRQMCPSKPNMLESLMRASRTCKSLRTSSRNQRLATSTHKALEEERRRRKTVEGGCVARAPTAEPEHGSVARWRHYKRERPRMTCAPRRRCGELRAQPLPMSSAQRIRSATRMPNTRTSCESS